MRLPRKNLEKLFKFESLNQENEIKKALTEAIELDPNNANSPFILRREYLINGDIDKDESEFLKSINLNNRLKMATNSRHKFI